MSLNENTRRFAIIGEDISHSKSPAMMNAAFAETGLDCHFSVINVEPENFAAAIRDIRENYAGITVTIPYKLEIMQYLDEIDPLAEVIGAVNTVKVEGGRLIGYNTDGAGFVAGLAEDRGVQVRDNSFFVIGAGGVARAIVATLAAWKPAAVFLESRTYAKTKALCDTINDNIYDCCRPLAPDADFRPLIAESSVLINATFVGMPPHENETPIEPTNLHPGLLVADVIYNPPRTKLLMAAEGLGCQTVNGQSLLYHQGKIAFKIWTGQEPPSEVMRQAVYN